MSDSSKKPSDPHALSDLLFARFSREEEEHRRYISQEFQDFGVRLSVELDDEGHKSLYIKLAKTVDRAILEAARTFVLDANARSKARLFMWKVKQLKEGKKKAV